LTLRWLISAAKRRSFTLAAWYVLATWFVAANSVLAQERIPDTDKIKPSIADHSYGRHERQVLDVYFAPIEGKRPVVINIHGGGWVRGDKTQIPYLKPLLDAGITVVSINYRFTWQAQKQGVNPPVSWPVDDAILAVQYVRSRAEEWGIDSDRVAATGGSAGACSSLLLATWPDQKNTENPDPITRQSSRLRCAAVSIAQTTLDPKQMREWIPNSVYGGHAFGFMDPDNLNSRDTQFERFLSERERLLPWVKKYSPWENVSSDDPPLFLQYQRPPTEDPHSKDPTHSTNFGIHFQKKCQEAGVDCQLIYPGSARQSREEDIPSFLIHRLTTIP
jgi:acetyl esterase/lipase